MIVKILLFAEARDLIGTDQVELNFDSESTTKEQLIRLLGSQFPDLGEILPSCNIAHNQTYINETETISLSATDELALIPPIGGG